MEKRRTKVAIIGAGSAGLSAAGEVKKHTDDYLVINHGPYGTTCARVGCMPSKVMIHAANDFHRRKVYSQIGINGGDDLSVEIPRVMQHVRGLRDRFVRGVMSGISGDKEHNIEGFAQFVRPDALQIGDDLLLEAENIIIATGSSPIVPAAWQEFRDRIVTTDEFFEQEDFPRRVAVVGMGVIGVELGMALARLGCQVVGVGRSNSIAGISDPVIADYAAKTLANDMELWLGKNAELSAASEGVNVVSGERKQIVDLVLASLGRKPNLENLGLERIGVELDDRGLPDFDRTTVQIGDLPIYLTGDVNAEKAILHEASDEGRIAGYNAVHSGTHAFKRRVALGICFSDPNIAYSGCRYEEIKDKNPVIGEVSFEGQGRSLSMVKAKGILRVYVCRDSAKLLGSEMIAPSGEHLAHLLSWCIQKEMDVFELLQMPFYHPVVEEGLRTALRDAAKQLSDGEHKLELARCPEEGDCLDGLC